MLFSTVLPALTAVTSVLGASIASRTTVVQPISRRAHGLISRQGPVVGVTLCTTLEANVPLEIQVAGAPILIGLSDDLCLCLVNGVLTPQSVDTLDTDLANNVNLDLSALGIDFNVFSDLVADVAAVVIGNEPTQPGQCVYPTGAIPNSCSACTFDCPADAPNLCDNVCTASLCPSSAPLRRARGIDVTLLCPADLTACGVSNHISSQWGNVECMDVQNNVETCGGCQFPLSGNVKGVDCTIIENAEDVLCVAGLCVVQSCTEGFTVVGEKCERV